MKILLSLFLFVFLSFETLAQNKDQKPFGIRYYGYMAGPSSRNISFKAKKSAPKGSRRWAYIDAQYRTLLFYNLGSGEANATHRTNHFFPGTELRINIPYRRHHVAIGGSYFLPINYNTKIHPFYGDEQDGKEKLYSLSLNYSYLFTLGKGRKRQVFFFQTGYEYLNRTTEFTKKNASDKDIDVSPEETYTLMSVGLGHHFSGPWFWEIKAMANSGDRPTVISLGMGYRLAIKR